MTSVEMVPAEARLSVTVGTVLPSEVVPWVKSTGPMPRIPSTPLNPVEVDATPILQEHLSTSIETQLNENDSRLVLNNQAVGQCNSVRVFLTGE